MQLEIQMSHSVDKTVRNHPFENDLYYLFRVILGLINMFYNVLLYPYKKYSTPAK